MEVVQEAVSNVTVPQQWLVNLTQIWEVVPQN